MEVKLPGGLPQNGCLERKARFHPLTGRIEQTLIESESTLDRPGYVTTVLCRVLHSIGYQPADAAQVSSLCVADRQFLMLRLAAMLDGEQMWMKVGCGHCDSLFDVEFRRCDLPVKEAGQGFPLVRLHLTDCEIEARVPTGEDQERIGERSEEEAIRQLLQNCIRFVNGEPPDAAFVDNLCEADIEIIDEALDDVSPAVCDQLLVICPECGREQNANLDHYSQTGLNEHFLFDEIHTLASHYHWSEADILDLPQRRRRRYLNLINLSTRASGRG
jgi:hypothetical protein